MSDIKFKIPVPKALIAASSVRYRELTRCGQKPLAGGKIFTYEVNSTTLKPTYRDASGLTPNTNPVVLDAAGEADIYLDGAYRIVVKDKNDVVQKDMDNINGWIAGGVEAQLESLNMVLKESSESILQPYADALAAAAAAGAGANGWDSTLVADGSETQKQINDKTIRNFENINDLQNYDPREIGQIAYVKNLGNFKYTINGWEIDNQNEITVDCVADISKIPVYLNRTVKTKSYFKDLNMGAWSYKYDGTIPKNKHNGGTIIDPTIVFTNLSEFLSNKITSGYGCYIALNTECKIPAEIFGANTSESFLLNDICVNAAITAAGASIENLAVKEITIGAGVFNTTDAIVNTSNRHIIPPKIIGVGREATQFIKKTNNVLGLGYLADPATDAVLVSSPRGDNPEGASAYLISEIVKGISLKHENPIENSVGWYRHRSAMGYADDIYAENNHIHFVFNDCWMTNFGQLWAHGGTHGYIFNVATSLRGGWLYATSTQGRAFLFDKVVYSDIKCCADHCGLAGDNGATAYRFVDCKGVSGKFNGENHRGELFSFTGSYGMTISGQDWRAKAVATNVSVLRMYFSYATVKFLGYDFLESASALTSSERKNYEFYQKDSISVIDFDVCTMPQQEYGASEKKPIHSILNGGEAFLSKLTDSRYIQFGKHVHHILALTTDWKMLCYVGASSRVQLKSATSNDPNQPYFCYIDNQENRDVGIKILAISKNPSSPTEIATIYVDNFSSTQVSTKLLAYIASDGWLYVKAASTGYSLEYAFDLII